MPRNHRLVFAKQQMERDQAQSAQNLIAANQLEQTQDAYAAALAGARAIGCTTSGGARNALQYTSTLFADHDGLITSENADTGQVVSRRSSHLRIGVERGHRRQSRCRRRRPKQGSPSAKLPR